jgi:hypothetical protein
LQFLSSGQYGQDPAENPYGRFVPGRDPVLGWKTNYTIDVINTKA